MVGISQPAVSDLIKRQVISAEGTAADWLLAYCGNLREQAAGRTGSDGSLDLVSERARLAKEQADKVAFQNAVTRNELAPVSLIEEVLAKAASKIAGIFDAIPGMIHRRVPNLSSEEIDLIGAEVGKARNVIAQMSLQDLDYADDVVQSRDDQVIEV